MTALGLFVIIQAYVGNPKLASLLVDGKFSSEVRAGRQKGVLKEEICGCDEVGACSVRPWPPLIQSRSASSWTASPQLVAREKSWRRVVVKAVESGVAVPGMMASLAYFDT